MIRKLIPLMLNYNIFKKKYLNTIDRSKHKNLKTYKGNNL